MPPKSQSCIRKEYKMTLQNITHRHPFQGIAHTINRVRAKMAKERKIRVAYDETRSELSAMSSRELNDIGIDRADISKVAAQAASMAAD